MLNYLDRVEDKLVALPFAEEVKKAAVRQEGLRRRPEALQGETPKAAALRGVLLMCAVVLSKAGGEELQAAAAVKDIFRRAYRASRHFAGQLAGVWNARHEFGLCVCTPINAPQAAYNELIGKEKRLSCRALAGGYPMQNLTVAIPHQLTRAEAKRRIQEHVDSLRRHPGVPISNVQETWTGDALAFSVSALGQTVSGHLTVDDHVVRVAVALPWFLNMLAGTVKERIEHQGRHLLTGPAKGK